MLQTHRGDRQDRNAIFINQKRIFVGTVSRAAILDDAQPPGGHQVANTVIQHDHAIGDVLFQPLPGEQSVAAFAGDDRGDAFALEPAEQAAQFRPQNQRIGQPGEQRFHGIQHHPFCTNAIDGVAEADEQAFQIKFAGFLDFAALDVDEIQRQLILRDQGFQIETERSDVLDQFLSSFLKGHEYARLVELGRAAHQKFHRQQGFATTRAAADQRRASGRQAAAGDFVQSLNAGQRFGEQGS